MQFVLIQEDGGAWRWELRSDDGTTLAVSPSRYPTRELVIAAIVSLKNSLPSAELPEDD